MTFDKEVHAMTLPMMHPLEFDFSQQSQANKARIGFTPLTLRLE
jgi:hypothetical protein